MPETEILLRRSEVVDCPQYEIPQWPQKMNRSNTPNQGFRLEVERDGNCLLGILGVSWYPKDSGMMSPAQAQTVAVAIWMRHVRKQVRRAEQDGLFRAATADDLFNLHLSSSISTWKPAPTGQPGMILWRGCRRWISWSAILGHVHLGWNDWLCVIASTWTWPLDHVALLFFWPLWSWSYMQVATVLWHSKIQHWGTVFHCCGRSWVFLGTYLFGHLLYPRRFWIDQVCVHPSDAEVKSRTLQAIPAFVAQSHQMLVIWDDTYWQRLWCNYEVAIYGESFLPQRPYTLCQSGWLCGSCQASHCWLWYAFRLLEKSGPTNWIWIHGSHA